MSQQVGKIASFASSSANEATARLQNEAANVYNKEIDAMFSLLHNDKSTAPEPYKSSDYSRYGFNTRVQAEEFAASMQTRGVSVAVSPVKLGNQYLVELPKQNDVNLNSTEHYQNYMKSHNRHTMDNYTKASSVAVQNANEEFRKIYAEQHKNDSVAPVAYDPANYDRLSFETVEDAQNYVDYMRSEGFNVSNAVSLNADGTTFNLVEVYKDQDFGTMKMSGADLIQQYSEMSYQDYQEAYQPEYAEGSKRSPDPFSAAASFISRNTESAEVQSIVNGAGSLIDWVSAGKVKGNEDVFTRKGGVDDRRFNSGVSEKAYLIEKNKLENGKVVKDYVVIVNGKEVTDKKAKEYVIKQHQERFANAIHYESRLKDKEKKFEQREEKREEKFDDFWEDWNDLRETSFEKREDKKEERFNRHEEKRQSRYDTEMARRREKAKNDFIKKGGTEAEFNAQAKPSFIVGADGHYGGFHTQEYERQRFMRHSYAKKNYGDTKAGIILNNSLDITQSVIDGHAQVYGSLNVGTGAGRTGGSLDYWKDRLNTARIAESLKSGAGFVPEMALIRSLQDNFNFKYDDAVGITRDNLLDLNQSLITKAEGLNLQIINPKGEMDFDVLTKYAKQLGLDENSLALFKDINGKGNWGGTTSTPLQGLASRGLTKFLQMTEDEGVNDVVNLVDKTKTGYSIAKETATSIEQYNKAKRMQRDARKAKKVSKGKTNGLEGKAGKRTKKKPNTKKAELDKKANEKFLKNQKRQLDKLKKAEKSRVRSGINRKIQSAQNKIANSAIARKFANSALGKAFTAVKGAVAQAASSVIAALAPIILGAIIILAGICVVAIVLMTILSLLEPEVDKTVAFKLATALVKNENEWIDDLNDCDKLFEERNEVSWTVDLIKYEDYIAEFDGVEEDGENFYINPFHSVEGLVTPDNENKSMLTKITGFTGERTFTLAANTSLMGEKKPETTDEEEEGSGDTGEITEDSTSAYPTPYVTTENGHTSNNKDILAMTDVMYQFEVNGSSDSVMGYTEGQVNWANFKNKICGFFKMLNPTNLYDVVFGEKSYYDYLDDGTASFNSIKLYAATLFAISHQQFYELDISFYRPATEEEATKYDGLEEYELSALGICKDPNTTDFPICYDQDEDKIRPYIEAEDGTIYYLDEEDQFEVQITMDNMTDPDDACLWDDMAADETTLQKIKDHMEAGHNCWSVEEDPNPVPYTEFTIPSSVLVCYPTEDPDTVITEAITSSSWYSALPENLGGGTYTLSDDHNTFTATYIKKLNPPKYQITNIEFAYRDIAGNIYLEYSYKAIPYGKVTETYTRECEKHEFTYCGGHLSVNVHGTVFSVMNEHLGLIDGYRNPEWKPFIIDYDNEAYDFKDIAGKVDWFNETDDSSLATKSYTGQSVSPAKNVQGSFPSLTGYNFYYEGGTWKNGYNLRSEPDGSFNANPFQNLSKDIFDMDMINEKGRNVFPLTGGELAWKKYDAWNSDNMTLVALKLEMNWYDLYEFDIPYEINTKLLSEKDIDNINKALGNDKGDDLYERTDSILGWVGKGHYSDYHYDHDFLSSICFANGRNKLAPSDDAQARLEYYNSVGLACSDACCTAADSESFAKYLLDLTKMKEVGSDIDSFTTYTGVSSLEAGDIIVHHGVEDLEDMEIPDSICDDGDKVVDYYRHLKREQYVYYVGKLNEAVTLEDGTEIPAGDLFIDLSNSNYEKYDKIKLPDEEAETPELKKYDVGTVRLRFKPAEDEADLGANTVYYWINNPDSQTEMVHLTTPIAAPETP